MNRKLKNIIHNILYIIVISGLISFSVVNSKCHAQTDIILHLASKHSGDVYYEYGTGKETQYNQNNYGVGIGYALSNNYALRAGVYNNSHSNLSVYSGVFISTNNNRMLKAGVILGGVTGYYNTRNKAAYNLPIAPLVLPTISATVNKINFEVSYLPAVLSGIDSVITFSTGVKF